MRRKELIIGLLCLFVFLASGLAGYYFLLSDTKLPNTPKSISEAEDRLQYDRAAIVKAETRVKEFEIELGESKNRADGARRRAEQLGQTSSDKNTRNATEAGKVLQANREAEELEASVAQVEAKLLLAKQEVKEKQSVLDSVQRALVDLRSQHLSTTDGAAPLLTLRNVSIALLSLSFAIVLISAFLLTRKSHRVLVERFASLRSGQEALSQQMEEAGRRMDDVKQGLLAFQLDVETHFRALTKDLATGHSTTSDADRDASTAVSPVDKVGAVTQPQESISQFPVAASDYIHAVQGEARIVRTDPHTGHLLDAANGQGELLLVSDRTGPEELLLIVPRYGQFQTKNDFFTYYERYYDCERPAGGEVWIVNPAVVWRVDDGWALREKGELEMR